ncbi:GerMN domain-containing protein [Paenibacillus sp. MMS18-CY102]|uniref:GerMN domain-containing protein n=1 Tax=Paenibacillus sp. MMS18-CY102 TaxID=2682849 RepID=UPI0013662D4A|nr:GerMN domain-containing protein [Paenibacillus sp. MMS18-CY102]MWC28532.1 hypothetical protein [Paenibacillus sp. MMS18-CY102]
MVHLRQKTSLLIAGALLLALLAGCGASGKPSGEESSNGQQQEQKQEQAQSPSEAVAEKKQATIHVYYSDSDLSVLVEQNRDITFANDSEKITATLQALQSEAQGNAVSLWNKVEVLSSGFKDGAVSIDLHIPEEARFGAPGEVMALEALKKTLFQFDEVTSIDILVDGQALDSLMGHEELPHPIVK